MPRNKFDVIRELGELDRQLEIDRDKGIPAGMKTIQRKTLLRHELKQFDRRTATGQDAGRVKELWQRQIEEEKKKQAIEKQKEKDRIKQAKKELKSDKSVALEMAEGLTVDQLQELINKKKIKK